MKQKIVQAHFPYSLFMKLGEATGSNFEIILLLKLGSNRSKVKIMQDLGKTFSRWVKYNSFFTLLGSQSEWPKDRPFLLMHSRHARSLNDSNIKNIFWNRVDAFWDNPIYPLLSTFIWLILFLFIFHAWVKKCHFGNFSESAYLNG